MSSAIDFLELLGQDAALRYATGDALSQAVAARVSDPALQAAILHGGQQRLETALGAATNVCCGVAPAKDDDEEYEEDEDFDEDEDDEIHFTGQDRAAHH
jgi:hypothetical protein